MRGFFAVLRRTLKVLSALGMKGLLGRLHAAGAARVPVTMAQDAGWYSDPVPVEQLNLRVGLMVHVFYPDLIDELARDLANVPLPFTLLVSVVDDASCEQVQHRFRTIANAAQVKVRVVENRGRDIAPLLVTFREEILSLDVVGHIHTKKSLYTGREKAGWRRYLLGSLFGDSDRVAWILGMFQAEPLLGLVYPESYEDLPLWGHTWLSNADVCDTLAARLGIAMDRNAYIDYPAGSMFWGRVDALRPLYDLKLTVGDFPIERGQVDGTLQHAIERLFATVARRQGLRLGILPRDGRLALMDEGERNWMAAFETPLTTRLQLSSLNAELVTVDVFDTLVTRPFLTPHGARSYLSMRVRQEFGIDDFASSRDAAETRARLKLRRDPTLAEIYLNLAELEPLAAACREDLQAFELATERQMLRVRPGVLQALSGLKGKRLAALSDMYLTAAQLTSVLPEAACGSIAQWWVSCETGLRKDQIGSWPILAQRYGVSPSRWLHVGDNEHADIQLPQLQKLLTPVHVLRPAALLDVVPALRPLRHTHGNRAAWPEQLWRGLLANRLATIADLHPERLSPLPNLEPDEVGYLVLGPLVLDFLLWTVRIARERGVQELLFLSREGHILQRAFELLTTHLPELADLRPHYFLASRRATGLPTLRTMDDLPDLLHGTFTGSLRHFLQARFGEAACDAVASFLGTDIERDVYLPEMRERICEWLRPCLPALFEVAAAERATYLDYWQRTVGQHPALVVDLGYAGTIQVNLAKLTGTTLGGAYFALRSSAHKIQPWGWAEARYFDGRIDQSEDSPILQHDLLLEALLSAPSGQFSGFAAGGAKEGPVPRFAPRELDQSGYAILEQVHQGALAFLDELCSVAGDATTTLVLDREGILTPLRCLATGRWLDNGWLGELATDDSFTGRGRIIANSPSTT